MTTRYPLYFKPGDDETRVFQYFDSAGAVVVITSYTASCVATVEGTAITVTGTVDGPNGKVTVSFTHTQTTSLGASGSHGSYELKITSPGGLITTIAEGPLSLLKE